MNIKKIVAMAITLASTGLSAKTMLDSDLYQMTQKTYINDIDAINISMGSMDKSCWRNLPYGAPYIKGSRSLIINQCGVIGLGKARRSPETEGPALNEFLSEAAVYAPTGKGGPISSIISGVAAMHNYPAMTSAVLKVANSISNEFEKSQKDLHIKSPIEARYIPPQVFELMTFTDKHNKVVSVYLVGLDAIARTQKFYKVDQSGVQNELSEKQFIDQTSLVVNPLYKR